MEEMCCYEIGAIVVYLLRHWKRSWQTMHDIAREEMKGDGTDSGYKMVTHGDSLACCRFSEMFSKTSFCADDGNFFINDIIPIPTLTDSSILRIQALFSGYFCMM